jgi:phenylpropionate dioxygenase-like ring-hydroxylating dioxygenase large terminal subunit
MTTEAAPVASARWWPVATTSELAAAGRFLTVQLLDKPWLVVSLDGELTAVRDECPHRRVPLSAGRRVDTEAGQRLECRYHGWQFAGSGACSAVPALGPGAAVPRGMRVDTAQVSERYGVVWLATHPPERPAPYVAELVRDDIQPPGLPQRWALPAVDLLVRIQRSLGGTLGTDGSSLHVPGTSPPDVGTRPEPVTLLVQPEGGRSCRLYTLRHRQPTAGDSGAACA